MYFKQALVRGERESDLVVFLFPVLVHCKWHIKTNKVTIQNVYNTGSFKKAWTIFCPSRVIQILRIYHGYCEKALEINMS